MQPPTDVSVVVASHGRPLRLRWLLNALQEQTLAPACWEVIVIHDYDRETAERLIRTHSLYEHGRLRELSIAAGTGSPARQRNLGWRMATGELIAFTDDDCRPEPQWLAHLLEGALRHPNAVIQGATRPDPLEAAILSAPHVRTMTIDPVGRYAQTCNLLYPRELLRRLDGFDEAAITGEDVDLWLRARNLGFKIAAAPEAIVNHAIESHSLPGILRQNAKWRHLAYVVKRHPELRGDFPLRLFWDREHFWTTTALVGILFARRSPALAGLAGPYALRMTRRRGSGARACAVALVELPGQAVRQAAEVAGLAVGGARRRTLVL